MLDEDEDADEDADRGLGKPVLLVRWFLPPFVRRLPFGTNLVEGTLFGSTTGMEIGKQTVAIVAVIFAISSAVWEAFLITVCSFHSAYHYVCLNVTETGSAIRSIPRLLFPD